MGAGVVLRTSGVEVKHEGSRTVLIGANPYNRQPAFAAVQDNAPDSGSFGWQVNPALLPAPVADLSSTWHSAC